MGKVNREQIEKLFEGMEIPMEFGQGEYGDYDSDSVTQVYDFFNTRKDSLEVDYGIGASKMAILIEGADEVVKIPFNGSFYSVEEYDEDEENYDENAIYDMMECFSELTWANDIEDENAEDWDYCQNEVIKYEIAKERGFADFFARIEHWKNIDFHPVYLQEKVTILSSLLDSEKYREPSKKAHTIYKSRIGRIDNILPSYWTMHAIDHYGEEKVEDFINFLKDESMDDDLHPGNVGFALDGRPVLLDWAGWRG